MKLRVVSLLIAWLVIGRMICPAATDAKPQAADVAALIAELDSNRYLVREQATQRLLTAGDAALDPLLAAANGDRPEPADRAVWVLRKLGESEDHQLALAALDRLVQVKGRPSVVQEASHARSHFLELACQASLAKLGGKMTLVDDPRLGSARIVCVELGDDWRGKPTDLQCLADLDQRHFFRLVGPAVGDDEVKLFERKNGLVLLQIFMSRVTLAAVDSLKEHHPKAIVYVRNRALLGIVGESQPNGVRVTQVPPNEGAANAGIAVGDVIMKIEGKTLKDFDRLTAIIAQHQPSDQVEVTILRGETTLTKRVTLSDRPPDQI